MSKMAKQEQDPFVYVVTALVSSDDPVSSDNPVSSDDPVSPHVLVARHVHDAPRSWLSSMLVPSLRNTPYPFAMAKLS
jgi:hypothetical protein